MTVIESMINAINECSNGSGQMIEVSADRLIDALRCVKRALPKRAGSANYDRHVLLKTTPGQLSVTATDGKMAMEVFMPTTGTSAIVTALVDLTELTTAVRRGGVATLVFNEDTIDIIHQNPYSKMTIYRYAYDGYPNIAWASIHHELGEVGAQDWQAIRERVIPFASTIETLNPTLTGVDIRLKNSRLEFTAADGFRLAHHWVEQVSDMYSPAPRPVLVPAKYLSRLPTKIKQIRFWSSEHQAHVVASFTVAPRKNVKMEGRALFATIPSELPDMTHYIVGNKHSPVTITVNAAALREAVAMKNPRHLHTATLRFDDTGALTWKSGDIVRTWEDVVEFSYNADTTVTPNMTHWTCNPTYLREVVQATQEPVIIIRTAHCEAVGVIDVGATSFGIMPMFRDA